MYDYQRPTRLTRPMIEQIIAFNLNANPTVLQFTKLTEEPHDWKHACVSSGVVRLMPSTVQFEGNRITFALCPSCAKILYYLEEGNI